MKTRVGRVETLLVGLIIIVLSCYFWDSSRSLLPGSPTKLSNEQTFQTIAKDEKARHDSDKTLPLPGLSHTEERHVFLEPTTRSSLKKHGARVACWPSSGGIWIKQADIVDMEFLGLNRFQDTPKQSNQTAEDNFCAKLKMTGADWWQLPLELVDPEQELCKTLETCFAPDIVNEYLIAWPETTETACYVSIALAEKRGGGLLNGYRNAMDMGERCGIITRLGGKECRCRAECPELDYLDWGSQDLENQSYDTPPVAVDLGLLDEIFDPKPTREVLRWANQFCERNGWRRII